jgi:hypothetical protein
MSDDLTEEDRLVTVQLPFKDYKVMREIIAERQAMSGLKKIIERFFWIAGGVLSVLGLIEILRRFG